MYGPLLKKFRVNTYEQLTEMAKTENMGFVLERLAFGKYEQGCKCVEIYFDEYLEKYCCI